MTMTVAELIRRLEMFEPDDLVVLAKDDEGDAFAPLESLDSQAYVATTEWSGEVLDQDDAAVDLSTGTAACVLWPEGEPL